MKSVEMLWRKSAARNRFQMRQCALWWKETGEEFYRLAAIEARDDAREALRIANHYAAKGSAQEKERAA